MKKRIIIAMLALVCVLGLLPALAEQPAEEGAAAPDFELTTLDDGTFSLSEQRGKVVFLNVWATWCPPCVAEIPDIQRLAEAHPEELVVIGASVDEAQESVDAFVEEMGVGYPIAMDEGYRLSAVLYPTQYIPESVFISPDGIVTRIHVGGLTYDQMEAAFQEALGQ